MGNILKEELGKIESLLKGGATKIEPLLYEQSYEVEYLMSHGQDSPFFIALAFEKLLGTRCKACQHTYATPRPFCMDCGKACAWVELPATGKIHSFTICHFGSEEFLKETPYMLVLVEFEGCNTLFLSRLRGVDQTRAGLDLIGMRVGVKFNPALKDKLEFMRKRKIHYKRTKALSPEEKELIKRMEIRTSDIWFEPA
jgi:hypothetical protein